MLVFFRSFFVNTLLGLLKAASVLLSIFVFVLICLVASPDSVVDEELVKQFHRDLFLKDHLLFSCDDGVCLCYVSSGTSCFGEPIPIDAKCNGEVIFRSSDDHLRLYHGVSEFGCHGDDYAKLRVKILSALERS